MQENRPHHFDLKFSNEDCYTHPISWQNRISIIKILRNAFIVIYKEIQKCNSYLFMGVTCIKYMNNYDKIG